VNEDLHDGYQYEHYRTESLRSHGRGVKMDMENSLILYKAVVQVCRTAPMKSSQVLKLITGYRDGGQGEYFFARGMGLERAARQLILPMSTTLQSLRSAYDLVLWQLLDKGYGDQAQAYAKARLVQVENGESDCFGWNGYSVSSLYCLSTGFIIR
jgi:hypothetical protein